jgi:hypothetical protein
VNLGSARELVGRFLGIKWMRIGGIYLMLTEKYNWGLFFMKKGS